MIFSTRYHHFKNQRKNEYIKGFYTGRNLQWTLSAASIPYSLAHVENEGWLVGDEGGNIWFKSDTVDSQSEPIENILEFESGVSEIAPLNRSKILVGEMRGSITQFDLNQLNEGAIHSVGSKSNRAPIKCIRWQPGQSEVFAAASQDGTVSFTDLRCPQEIMGSLNNPHQLQNPVAKGRSTMTGLVFNPLKPELFYTTGTPDTCVRLWDMRKLSQYSSCSNTQKRTRKSALNVLTPVEEFSTASCTSRKHRSSVALTIDSTGSRLFLATSNDNIFEFLTCNSEIGPVASYSASGFSSCSFFSNLSIDPSDRFILSGSSNGQAYIWDTLGHCSNPFELPVCAQLEVSKTAWAVDRKGSLEAQIACISDDLTFSLFDWNLADFEDQAIKRPKEIAETGREVIHRDDLVIEEVPLTSTSLNTSNASSTFASMPVTPVRKKPQSGLITGTPPPNSANKSILDFFTRSPRVE